MALTDKLIAIADAIRGKTGGTDALTLDQMATAIAAIETGGGGSAVQSGSFTPAEKLYNYTISVDGTVKNFIIWKNTNALTYGVRTFVSAFKMDGTAYQPCFTTNNAGTSAAANYGSTPISITDGAVTIALNSTLGQLVTEQYNWVAW